MANFEYYLELYSNNKRMLYRQAYEAAYRDLMGEYEDDLRVQGILIDQLGVEAGTTKKLSSSVSKAEGENKYKRALVAAKVVKQQQDNQTGTRKARTEARESAQDMYDISKFDARIAQIRQKTFSGQASTRNHVEREIDTLIYDMEREQKDTFVANALGVIIDDFNNQVMQRPAYNPADLMEKQTQANRIGLENKTAEQVQLEMQAEMKRRYSPVTGDREMTKYQKDFVREGQAVGLDVKQNSDGTFTVGSEIIDKDKLRLTRPTEQDILARAAKYYEPTGSKKFKKGMEEIAVEREAKAAAGKKAKQEMVASLPEWGGQVLKVAPKMEKFAGDDDNTLLDSTDTGVRLGVQTYNSGQFEDVGTALAHINSQDTDDLQKQAAIASYMSRHLREYRTNQNDSLEKLFGEE